MELESRDEAEVMCQWPKLAINYQNHYCEGKLVNVNQVFCHLHYDRPREVVVAAFRLLSEFLIHMEDYFGTQFPQGIHWLPILQPS